MGQEELPCTRASKPTSQKQEQISLCGAMISVSIFQYHAKSFSVFSTSMKQCTLKSIHLHIAQTNFSAMYNPSKAESGVPLWLFLS